MKNLNSLIDAEFAIEQQVDAECARYARECGPVKTFKMSDSVMEQTPVAYAADVVAPAYDA